MSEKRRDNKKRLLWEGEVQEQNGRYKYVYSWRLTSTDPFPAGKNQIYHCEKKNRLFRRKY